MSSLTTTLDAGEFGCYVTVREVDGDPEQRIIEVEAGNPGAASIQVHVDGEIAVDVTIGEAIQFEGLIRTPQERQAFMQQFAEIVRGVARGDVTEKIRRRKGAVGFSSGRIMTDSGPLKSAVVDAFPGWLLGKAEIISYAGYAPGPVSFLPDP